MFSKFIAFMKSLVLNILVMFKIKVEVKSRGVDEDNTKED